MIIAVTKRIILAHAHAAIFFFYFLISRLVNEKILIRKDIERGEVVGGKIAIIAMWQSILCSNFLGALKAARQSGYILIVVNNCILESSDINEMQGLADVYIERDPGFGRDFAAYKTGVNYLNRMVSDSTKIDSVLFFNDSMVYFPSRLHRLFEYIDSIDRDVITLTESFVGGHHQSSWFFQVSGRVYFNEKFQGFWRRYKPCQSRVYTIKSGELGLSKIYSKLRITPHAIYNSAYFLRGLDDSIRCDDIYKLLSLRLQEALFFNEDYPARDVFINALLNKMLMDNPTHAIGLLLFRYFDFPAVKKDIYSKMVNNMHQIRMLFELNQEVPESDRNACRDVIEIVASRRRLVDEPFHKRIIMKIGYI